MVVPVIAGSGSYVLVDQNRIIVAIDDDKAGRPRRRLGPNRGRRAVYADEESATSSFPQFYDSWETDALRFSRDTLARRWSGRATLPDRQLPHRRPPRGGWHGRCLPRVRRGAAAASGDQTPAAEFVDPSGALRFRREARMAARLNHPAIVHIYDILETADGDWIVMELVEGKTRACRGVRGAKPLG